MPAGIAAKHCRLSGTDYRPGEPVPADVVNRRTIELGFVYPVPEAATAGIRAGEGATVEAFDPGEHTYREITAYLDEHPDQLDRIRDAETAGRDRKGVLEAIAQRQAALANTGGGGQGGPSTETE